MVQFCCVLMVLVLSTAAINSTLVPTVSENNCPSNCSCFSTTITCESTIPDKIPDYVTEVVLENIFLGKGTRRFCNVQWDNVRKLSILNFIGFGLYDYVFDCLGQIEALEIRKSYRYSYVLSKNFFFGLSNVSMLQISECRFRKNSFTTSLSVRTNLPKLSRLKLSSLMNNMYIHVDQDTIDAFSLRPLDLLDLSRDRLTFDFQNSSTLCQTLHTLILHDSDITEDQLPHSCPSLQYVDLSGNLDVTKRLKQCVNTHIYLPIPSFYIGRVMHLNRTITDNAAHRISKCEVSFPSKLLIRKLYFSHNYIPAFEIVFDFWYGNLEYINLSHNKIRTINKNALGRLRRVVSIDISNNKLNEMHGFKDSFSELFVRNLDLVSIDLSSNSLSYLPDESFGSNFRLREIHLSRNRFKQLSLNFSHLYNLTILDLRFNRIEQLDSQSRQVIDKFYSSQSDRQTRTAYDKLTVLLEGNPFSCGCEALEFLQWFVTSPIYNPAYLCQVNGKTIPMTAVAVSAAKTECERVARELRTTLLSTILPVIALAAILAVAVIGYKRHKRKLMQQRLDDRVRLIQEQHTGHQFTVFLSYCSSDIQFVAEHVRQPLQENLRRVTQIDRELVCEAELHFIPGHNVFEEMRRCVAESAVFVAIMSKNYCKSTFCQLEISEARTTKKPVILIFKEDVDPELMTVPIRDLFENNARAKIVFENGQCNVYPGWEQLCDAIIRLMRVDIPEA